MQKGIIIINTYSNELTFLSTFCHKVNVYSIISQYILYAIKCHIFDVEVRLKPQLLLDDFCVIVPFPSCSVSPKANCQH